MENQKRCAGCEETVSANYAVAQKAIQPFKDEQGALIQALHKVQGVYGYLPEEALKLVSSELDVPISDIYGVASFYSLFSLEPKGEHVIDVCIGTACYVKGAQDVLDRLSKELGLEPGQTTEDGKFTLQSARCIGACGLAPVILIDGKAYGKITPDDIPDILKEYK